MARDYGVLMEVGHSLRGLFIIDPKGVIRHITMNDPPVSRNAEEVLRLVKAYQYTDSHGEVCPAGWKKPGDATIVPNPTGKLEYAIRVCKLLLHDLCMTCFVLYFQILPIDQQVERQTRVSSQSFLCCVDGWKGIIIIENGLSMRSSIAKRRVASEKLTQDRTIENSRPENEIYHTQYTQEEGGGGGPADAEITRRVHTSTRLMATRGETTLQSKAVNVNPLHDAGGGEELTIVEATRIGNERWPRKGKVLGPCKSVNKCIKKKCQKQSTHTHTYI